MTDHRRHRGPHPEDEDLFAPTCHKRLRTAVDEFSWLLDRGYPSVSALQLVGDRHALRGRQRIAVRRCSCSTADLAARAKKRLALTGACDVWIDGFNLLTTIEAALSGGVILIGRDDCYRDMAGMHGTYRRVSETHPALELIGSHLERHDVQKTKWLLDQPVSNSGRLSALIRAVAEEHDWQWEVETVRDPDPVLIQLRNAIVISADSEILNKCQQWANIAGAIVQTIKDAVVVDMS